MTRAEQLLYRRRGLLWIVAALLFLGGAVAIAFLQIDKAQHRGDQLAAEADLRGGAVTTLATDVRTLRAQIQADGKTPQAPDPSNAVHDLPDRSQVPVPIPGPPGPPGPAGKAAPTITPAPGTPGRPGADSSVPGPAGPPGADSTVAGPPGPAGPAGADSTVPGPQGEQGEQGEQGPAGPNCPDGYSLQAPADDPDALICRRNGAPQAPDGGPTTPQTVALDPFRRQYP